MQTLADHPLTSSAMATLTATHPLLVVMLSRLPVVEDDERSNSISMDGESILLNPGFIRGRSEEGRVYLLAFMGLMLVDDFIGRKGDREPSAWSMACNISLHNQLAELGVSGRPMEADDLYDPEMAGLIADEIYERLTDGRKLVFGLRFSEMLEVAETQMHAEDMLDTLDEAVQPAEGDRQ